MQSNRPRGQGGPTDEASGFPLYEQQKWTWRRDVARELQLDGADDVGLVTVQAFRAPTRVVGPRRRDRLRAHLAALIPLARADAGPRPTADEPPRTAPDVCRACRGNCCASGGDHAFLTGADVAASAVRFPALEPQELVERYMAFVPSRTYRGSCIYHSARGCGLPADLRSRACNRFLCAPVQQLKEQFGAGRKAMVVALGTPSRSPARLVVTSVAMTRKAYPKP